MNFSVINAMESYFGAKAENITVRQCAKGDVNSTYIAEYCQKKCFVKIHNPVNMPSLYENQILREFIGTSLCLSHGISCPQIISCDPQEGFIITEYIDLPLLGDVWHRLDISQRKTFKEQALFFINEMNKINSDAFGAVYSGGKLKQCLLWTDSYKNIAYTALDDCIEYKTLSRDECGRIRERVEKNCLQLEKCRPQTPVFAHLDFHWNNIFVDTDKMRLAFIFDFGSSLYTTDYMGFFRLDGGFLYGTERFYDTETAFPIKLEDAERECAVLLNTLDYFTFLSFKGMDGSREKAVLLEN